jgi:hypothetical protein
MDILDLMPADQKLLTELAWEAVSDHAASLDGPRVGHVYASMLDAFTFQNMLADVAEVERRLTGPELPHSVKVALVRQLCWAGRVAEAWVLQEAGRGIAMSESLASSFIQGHASLGELARAENVLKSLNYKNIYWGNSCYEAFVLGCARAGDLERMDFFLQRLKTPSDQLVLAAIAEVSRGWPDRLGPLLDLPPRSVEEYSAKCRRTVKTLVESGNVEAAVRVVSQTRLHKLLNTDKERVVRICPSVIVVTRLMAESTDAAVLLERILELVPADPKIVSRTVPLAIDLCFRNSLKMPLCRAVIARIHASFPEEGEAIKDLVGQSCKRYLRLAAASESEEEVYKAFRIFSHLGLKLEGRGRSGSSRGWDLVMNRLIPTIPTGGSWTERSLQSRCWEVRDELKRCHDGLYSNSVIWGSVMQHLLNREDAVFFKVAASLSKELGAAYAPRRWVLSLSNCLLKLEDVQSYVEILQVAYDNCEKRGDTSDLEVITESLLHLVARGQRRGGRSTEGSHVLRVHQVGARRRLLLLVLQVLVMVLDEVWARRIRLPNRVVEKLAMCVNSQGNQGLATAVRNVPVMEQGGALHWSRRHSRSKRTLPDVRVPLRRELPCVPSAS